MTDSSVNTLKEQEGEMIALLSPFWHNTKIQRVKLHRVEEAGIWVENHEVSMQLLSQFGVTSSPKTAVWFLPWHQITTILGSLDAPSFSEKSLGF